MLISWLRWLGQAGFVGSSTQLLTEAQLWDVVAIKISDSGEEDSPHKSWGRKQRQGAAREEVAGSGDVTEQEHLCSEQHRCPDRRREADPPAQEARLAWNQRREVWRHTAKDTSRILSWGESCPSSTLSPGDS